MAASALTALPILSQEIGVSVYAPNQIICSEKISGVLDQARLWTNVTTHVRHVTDGSFPVKAEVEVSLDPTLGEFQDEWFPFKLPAGPHYKRCMVSLESCRNRLSEFNRISVMIYPDMPDRAAIWFEAVGAPSWVAATFPLLPGQWNKIHLNISDLKPEERTRITKLMIGGTPMGRLPGDPQWQRYYLKDLCFESILPRQTQGWEVSDRYVSLSQIGFTPWHPDKKAVFSGSLKADQFRIRTADGDAVSLSGSLVTLTNALGVFKVADFSGLQEEGRYYIEAGDTRSVVFPITPDPFKPAIEKYLHFLTCMRSGIATPAHPVCFMDDAVREDTRESIDMVGGWFDASDLRLYVSMSMTSILRPLAIAATTSLAKEPLGRALREEAQWGANFFNKMWDVETGLPFTMTTAKTTALHPLGSARSSAREPFYVGNPIYSPYVVGLESYGLSRMAAFLNDAELQTIAVNQLHWQLGKNPLSQSLLADVGDDYKPDMMSTVLGFMPGMISIGIGSKDGKPNFPQHHGNNEIYTQLTPYLQAMVQAHAPCVLQGTVTRNNAPAKGIKLRFRSKGFDKIFTTKTDRSGRFSGLRLPGGLTYNVEYEGAPLASFTAISGMKKSLDLDLAGGFELLRTVTPVAVAPSAVFETVLEVMVHGSSNHVCAIEVHGHNVKPVETRRSVTLSPGVNKLTFAFEAQSNADVPYAVMFTKQGQRQDVTSAVGTIGSL